MSWQKRSFSVWSRNAVLATLSLVWLAANKDWQAINQGNLPTVQGAGVVYRQTNGTLGNIYGSDDFTLFLLFYYTVKTGDTLRYMWMHLEYLILCFLCVSMMHID